MVGKNEIAATANVHRMDRGVGSSRSFRDGPTDLRRGGARFSLTEEQDYGRMDIVNLRSGAAEAFDIVIKAAMQGGRSF